MIKSRDRGENWLSSRHNPSECQDFQQVLKLVKKLTGPLIYFSTFQSCFCSATAIDIIDDVMHACNVPRLASQSSSQQEAFNNISLDIKQVLVKLICWLSRRVIKKPWWNLPHDRWYLHSFLHEHYVLPWFQKL